MNVLVCVFVSGQVTERGQCLSRVKYWAVLEPYFLFKEILYTLYTVVDALFEVLFSFPA